MKSYKYFLTLVLAITCTTVVGCGGSDEEQNPNGAVVGAPSVPNNGANYCANGSVFNGAQCVPFYGQPIACANGYVWSNNSCVPTSYGNNYGNNLGCPSTMSWDNSNYGCGVTGAATPSMSGWQCQVINYNSYNGMYYYVCRYVQYAPSGCFWTYYGPVCR